MQTETRPRRHLASDQGGHIRGLDGLRAIGVLAVIIYHVTPAFLPGGYLGVDVFFVVSGFLITTLLLRDMRTKGRVDLKRFWVRRARRLLPALVALVVTVIPIAGLINKDLLVGIGRQLIGALTFSTNWVEIAHGSSYFDNTSPLLFKNFWSLAVEEQFYVFWPILFILLLAFVRTWKNRIIVVLGAAGVSAVLMGVLASEGGFTRVYYGTDTHMFGLAIGVALAFIWAQPRGEILGHRTWQSYSQVIGLGSLAGLFMLMTLMSDETMIAYRGGILLASILTAILIAAMIAPGSPLARMSDNRVMTWVGHRSYGLYLWHWPILVMVSTAWPAAEGSLSWWLSIGLALGLTFLICDLSFRYLETPLRVHGFRATWAWLANGWQAQYRPVVATSVAAGLFAAATLGAVAVAPEKSSVQAAIEAAEADIEGTPSAPVAQVKPEPTPEPVATEDAVVAVPTGIPDGSDITAIGDSLIVTSKDGLDVAFPGINYLAKSNRQWHEAPAIVDAGLAEGTIRDNVILDFGTNAGVPDPDVVRAVIDKLGDRRIVLVNIYGRSTFITAANEALTQIADEYPNVVLADWHSAIAAEPHKLQADGTHPDMEGMHLFAQTVEAAFAQFGD